MSTQLPRSHYYGSQLLSIDFPEAKLIEAEYSPFESIPEHSHESAYMCLVIKGSYTERVHGSNRCCEARTAIFHPAGERHSDKFGRRMGRVFMIEPSAAWLQRCREHAIALDERVECRAGTVSLLMSRIYCESTRAEQHSPLIVEALLLEIAVALAKMPGRWSAKPPAWLLRIRERLREEYASAIRLEVLAAAERVHPTVLAHAFRRYFGTTAGEYLRRLRVEAACRQLLDCGQPLASIALDCGFASQSHFCTTFRRSMGFTPIEYRRRSAGVVAQQSGKTQTIR
jgi:AraC family transcriptional regulator